jgi:nucleoid-associated protein YgaU
MKKLGIVMAILFAVSASAFAADEPFWRYEQNPEEYDTMTYETYEIALAEAQQREMQLREEIAEEQARIESLKQQISETEMQIAQVIQEKYDILGITEEDVIAARNEIAAIDQELDLLLALTPDELAQRMEDIRRVEARIADLKSKPVSYLWEIRDEIIRLEEKLARVKANLPDKPFSYTVQLIPGNRECLWRIADYQQIYGDATQWPKLYRANQPLIDNYYRAYTNTTDDPKYTQAEDLIIPGWELDIPR